MTTAAVLQLLPELVREQIEHRELLLRVTLRDLILRYKQTIMGFGWAVFMPLVNTAVFSVIFTRVARVDVGMPYPLFAYSGLLIWNFFASSLRFSVVSLTANSNLVTKVYFPREIFPFSAVLVALVDTAVGSAVLIVLMAWYRIATSEALLFLPIILMVNLLFTAAVALLLSMANLFYRDVKYLFEVAITVWMFATSVLYPLNHVGGKAGFLLMLNPMTHILDAYRAVLFFHQLPPAAPFTATAAVAVSTFAVAWMVFHAAEFRFAENI
jgi:ABC-type polysaccharide/polyol phosphate export permease